MLCKVYLLLFIMRAILVDLLLFLSCSQSEKQNLKWFNSLMFKTSLKLIRIFTCRGEAAMNAVIALRDNVTASLPKTPKVNSGGSMIRLLAVFTGFDHFVRESTLRSLRKYLHLLLITMTMSSYLSAQLNMPFGTCVRRQARARG